MERNAVILAAGFASRFVPVSLEKPKCLVPVKGEILIERQIRQLREAGIDEIVVICGYMKEQFEWLKEKYDVILIDNPDYASANNISSLYYGADYLKNTYICLADHYYPENPFLKNLPAPVYLASYAEGPTREWCLTLDEEDRITDVEIGGANAWYMAGYAWFTREFSESFVPILKSSYSQAQNRKLFWEDLYIAYMEELPDMYARKAERGAIYEFDSLDELRIFDWNYLISSGSSVLEELCRKYGCTEGELYDFSPIKDETGRAVGFYYSYQDQIHCWRGKEGS